jgi:hypothetical protein
VSASYATNAVHTGSNLYVPVWVSNSPSITSSIYADGVKAAIGSASFDSTDPEVFLVWGNNNVDANSIAAFYHTTNSYAQVLVQNRSGSNSASADLIMQSDVPTSQQVGYLDLGINNQGYSETFFNINGPLDGYLYCAASGSTGGNLAIACDTSGKSIQFAVGGLQVSNQIMQISDVATQVQITGSLGVTSGITASAISASSYRGIPFSRGGTFYDALGIAGTASYSQSVVIWRAPFNCTVTNVWGYLVGTAPDTASVNARRNRTGQIASGSGAAQSHIVITGSLWQSASSILTSSFSTGDTLEIMLISSSGFPVQIAVQVDFVM